MWIAAFAIRHAGILFANLTSVCHCARRCLFGLGLLRCDASLFLAELSMDHPPVNDMVSTRFSAYL